MAALLTGQRLHDLSGRIAIVTGGGTGIGVMISQGFAANGATVYITGRRKDTLEKAVSEWASQRKDGQGEILPLVMDVTDKKSIMEAHAVFTAKHDKLHVLVNNAGQVGPRSWFMNDPQSAERQSAESFGKALFEGEAQADWRGLFDANVFSMFYVTTAFLGLLDAGSKTEDGFGFGSSVINITSISGLMKVTQAHFCYNTSKAAAAHLTRLMATEFALKSFKIRVNAIAPGVFQSQMTNARLAESSNQVDKIAGGLVPNPNPRPGLASEMAGTALYLASPATGGYTTGQEIVIDGGFLAVNPSSR